MADGGDGRRFLTLRLNRNRYDRDSGAKKQAVTNRADLATLWTDCGQ